MNRFLSILRWTARLSGVGVAGAFLLLILGELVSADGPGPNGLEWMGIGLLITACVATVIAWRWEIPGAAVCLVSLGIVVATIQGSRTFHRAILVMAIPAILHAVHGLTMRAHARERAA